MAVDSPSDDPESELFLLEFVVSDGVMSALDPQTGAPDPEQLRILKLFLNARRLLGDGSEHQLGVVLSVEQADELAGRLRLAVQLAADLDALDREDGSAS
jgi:hypothetical protein